MAIKMGSLTMIRPGRAKILFQIRALSAALGHGCECGPSRILSFSDFLVASLRLLGRSLEGLLERELTPRSLPMVLIELGLILVRPLATRVVVHLRDLAGAFLVAIGPGRAMCIRCGRSSPTDVALHSYQYVPA